jgi:hypothetical protein
VGAPRPEAAGAFEDGLRCHAHDQRRQHQDAKHQALAQAQIAHLRVAVLGFVNITRWYMVRR